MKVRSAAVALGVAVVASCRGPDALPPPGGQAPEDAGFANLEAVTIMGYTGPQEDPVISPDGQHLFFDSHDDSSMGSSLFWADLIDYKTFQFMGEVQGVNFPGEMTLRGNHDLAHDFFFVSTKFLTPCGMMAHGQFDNGVVTAIASVRGICAAAAPAGDINVTFDVAVTPDGGTLYFSESVVNNTGPQTLADRDGVEECRRELHAASRLRRDLSKCE